MDLVRFVNHAYASSLRATAPTLDNTCTTSAGALKLASALARLAVYLAKSRRAKLGSGVKNLTSQLAFSVRGR